MKRLASHLPRVFLGLVFTVFGAAGLFHLLPQQPLPPGIAGTFSQVLAGTYLLTLVKLTELVAGVLLLSNRFTALGAVLLAPVVVNIVAFHALVLGSGVGLPLALVAALGAVAWQQRALYRPLFTGRPAASEQPAPALQVA